MSSSSELRPDQLSRRLFIAGCFGLPWLWVVHTLFWHSEQKLEDRSLLDSNQQPEVSENETDENGEPVLTAAEIKYLQRVWVKRCRNSAILVTLGWIVWIVVVQFIASGLLPSSCLHTDPLARLGLSTLPQANKRNSRVEK